MVEDVRDYSSRVLIKGFPMSHPCPQASFLQTPLVTSLWLYLADRYMQTLICVRTHTRISCCQTHAGHVVGFC